MRRVIAHIDEFNLYHSLADNPTYSKYKWLNIRALLEMYVQPKQLKGLCYFTSLTTWNPDKMSWHKVLIRAFEHVGANSMVTRFLALDNVGRQRRFLDRRIDGRSAHFQVVRCFNDGEMLGVHQYFFPPRPLIHRVTSAAIYNTGPIMSRYNFVFITINFSHSSDMDQADPTLAQFVVLARSPGTEIAYALSPRMYALV